MRKVLVTFIIISLLFLVIHADELTEKENPEKTDKGGKPAYCIELPFLNSTMNIMKDNLCLGCATGLPLAIMLVVGFVAFIIFLIVLIAVALAGGDTSSLGTGAIITMLTITGLSFIGGILVNILAPFYDYNTGETKRMWQSPAVILERVVGWGLAIGASVLIIWQISNNN